LFRLSLRRSPTGATGQCSGCGDQRQPRFAGRPQAPPGPPSGIATTCLINLLLIPCCCAPLQAKTPERFDRSDRHNKSFSSRPSFAAIAQYPHATPFRANWIDAQFLFIMSSAGHSGDNYVIWLSWEETSVSIPTAVVLAINPTFMIPDWSRLMSRAKHGRYSPLFRYFRDVPGWCPLEDPLNIENRSTATLCLRSDKNGLGRRRWPRLARRGRTRVPDQVTLQACEGSFCLTQAMPSLCTDPGAGQGSATGKAGALRASLTGPEIGAYSHVLIRKLPCKT
jgi:hypothetical protein